MKRVQLKILTLSMSLFLIIGFASCKSDVNDPAKELITGKKITVQWNSDEEDISSYEANVTVYKMNNRKDSSFKLDSSYRLSTRLINNEQYTRLDMSEPSPDGQFRSIISSPEEMIIFNSSTEEIERRALVVKEAQDFVFLQNNLGFGKVNLDLVKKEAKRLAFDMTEDTNTSNLIISLPNEAFFTEGEKRISTRISYDTITETLTNIETIDVIEDGPTVTTSIEFVYQEIDGKYVKVGMISTIDTKYDDLIFEDDVEQNYFESYDDIPVISDEDFSKMQGEGNIFEDTSITLGNPSDLSSVVTVVEVYEDVLINDSDNSAFRLVL